MRDHLNFRFARTCTFGTGVLLLMLLGAACATKPLQRGPLPLDLIAAAGGWSGKIGHGRLDIEGGERPLRVSRPDVLSEGRTSVLLNSDTDDGQYVSVWVGAETCRAQGKTYPYSFTACVAPKQDHYACLARLIGCAEPSRRAIQ